ncbi:hypothetical protein ACFW5G_11660 [Streptomyces griseoaurantiacus]|uniref:hypothetical protein n=1 Tax=Streptomyces griseoaurantiacus TaxID=68213 RepID=UPI003681F83C
MPNDEDDEERDIHTRIYDVDTGKEIRISTIRDRNYERLVDFREYSPSVKVYGDGVTIPLTELHDFLEVVTDAAWQKERRGKIDHHSRVYVADNMEVHVSTIRDDDSERLVVFREYNTSVKEYGEGLSIPIGLLNDFRDGVTDAWHANGSGDWEGELGPYMGGEGPDE